MRDFQEPGALPRSPQADSHLAVYYFAHTMLHLERPDRSSCRHARRCSCTCQIREAARVQSVTTSKRCVYLHSPLIRAAIVRGTNSQLPTQRWVRDGSDTVVVLRLPSHKPAAFRWTTSRSEEIPSPPVVVERGHRTRMSLRVDNGEEQASVIRNALSLVVGGQRELRPASETPPES